MLVSHLIEADEVIMSSATVNLLGQTSYSS